MVSCAAQFKNQAYDHLVPLSYINMNINSSSSCKPAPVRIKNNVLWCGHIFLRNKKNKHLQNIQHLVANSEVQENSCINILCATAQFDFSCCLCPLSQRRVFPPAASAITSGAAQPGESFQATTSQTAETQLKATAARALSLGTLSSRKTHSVI